MVSHEDRQILRELACRVADIAALPVQEEKRRLWRALNALKPERPMVMIDQVCWSELNAAGELTLRCVNDECREYETILRRTLYQWAHFPVDMVVDPFIRVQKAVTDSGFGQHGSERVIKMNEDSEVASHYYHNTIKTMDDVEKMRMPVISHDAVETKRRMDLADWLFGGVIDIREEGISPSLSIWDPLCVWMGPEGVMYALADQPEMMHALAKKMSDGYMGMIDQLENLGLLCRPQSLIHCTGAFTDELPAEGFDPNKPRARDIWTMGLAQMLASVSPRMFYEYEAAYMAPLFERFGLVYYGCCDPLDHKMKEVRMLPNVRKVSMSPWADHVRGAEEIGADYVFSAKPNPAYVAMSAYDGSVVEREIAHTLSVCAANHCPVELILKDISTVLNDPRRLDLWADLVMSLVCR